MPANCFPRPAAIPEIPHVLLPTLWGPYSHLPMAHLPCEDLQSAGGEGKEGQQVSLFGPCGGIPLASFFPFSILSAHFET